MSVRDGEVGMVTVWASVVVSACFAMAALVLDGGVVLRARSEAFSLAGAAARAGAQQVSESAGFEGRTVIDADAATGAALAYLDARGASGTVSVSGSTVTVTVATTAELQLVAVLGADTVSVDATATAEAVAGP